MNLIWVKAYSKPTLSAVLAYSTFRSKDHPVRCSILEITKPPETFGTQYLYMQVVSIFRTIAGKCLRKLDTRRVCVHLVRILEAVRFPFSLLCCPIGRSIAIQIGC